MRAGRLLTMMLLLQDRGSMTARQLAAATEVSVRTVYRDVAALQAAGVPLWTEPGPSGGIRMVQGWRSRLDGLTGPEAEALFLSGVPGAAAELGLGALLATAELKVLAALPGELRAGVERVRHRFHLDASAWFHRPDPTDALAPIARAVWDGRRVDVDYGSPGNTVHRRLDPLGLVLKAGTWYLVASHRGRPRTWRVGRIQRVTPRDEPVRRPPDFELAGWWAASSAAFDRSLLRYRARLRLDAAALRRLPDAIGVAEGGRAVSAAGPPDEHGWVTVVVHLESEAVGAHQLMALGGGVEVLAPVGLRRAVHRAAADLAVANGPGPSRLGP